MLVSQSNLNDTLNRLLFAASDDILIITWNHAFSFGRICIIYFGCLIHQIAQQKGFNLLFRKFLTFH